MTLILHSSAFALEPCSSSTVTLVVWCTLWLVSTNPRPAHSNNVHLHARLAYNCSNRCTPTSPKSKCRPSSYSTGYAFRCGKSTGSVGASKRVRRNQRPNARRKESTDLVSGWNSSYSVRRWTELVIDSGCTWHVHNRLEDLVNVRPCNDVIEDAAGKQMRCTKRGDLPLLIRSTHGVEFVFLLRGVRWAPGFPDSLLSVDQLWETSKADCVFRDELRIKFTHNLTNRGEPLTSPFRRANGLYRWTVAVIDLLPPSSQPASARRLANGLHASGSTSHLSSLPADSLASLLHRRLHVGVDCLRRLGELASDVPAHIQGASTAVNCTHCAAANSTRRPHSVSTYEPTHVGRLVHMDIAGPFKPSEHGGYRYCLVLVDDHSRHKFVYFLHKRSDARDKVKRFVAEMQALASRHSPIPINRVGSLRSDNAGEFVSKEFTDLSRRFAT